MSKTGSIYITKIINICKKMIQNNNNKKNVEYKNDEFSHIQEVLLQNKYP